MPTTASPRPTTARPFRTPLRLVTADAWTPQCGIVEHKAKYGVFVDFGCEYVGLLPSRGFHAEDERELAAMKVGDPVTVYVVSKNQDSNKIRLSLQRGERPHIPWTNVIADGITPYKGHIANIQPIGLFVDMGTTKQCLVATSDLPEPGLGAFVVGQALTVYIVEKRRDTGKIMATLRPGSAPQKSYRDLVADGVTPHHGRVVAVNPGIGAFVDIGYETRALIPMNDLIASRGTDRQADPSSLLPNLGEELVLYVTNIARHAARITGSLRPRTEERIPVKDLVVDGQTAYDGLVVSLSTHGAFIDIGAETVALLPASSLAEKLNLDIGSRVKAYIAQRRKSSGKITVRLESEATPRKMLEALVCDGQTPYEGVVMSNGPGGVFVDIGCEQDARIEGSSSASPSAIDLPWKHLAKGVRVTTYVVEVRHDSGQISVSLERQQQPLRPLAEAIVDGQTAYQGTVVESSAAGISVDIGLDCRARLRWRPPPGQTPPPPLFVGSSVTVYCVRRSMPQHRLTAVLERSPVRRRSRDEVLSMGESATFLGQVYALGYDFAFVDFDCEAGGKLPRTERILAVGDMVLVRVEGVDEETGHFVVARVRPPPPPRAPGS